MPIPESLLTHELFAPSIRHGYKQGMKEGRQQGREEGREEGLEQGRHETALKMVRLMISQRFGRVPAELSRRLKTCSAAELEALATRVFKVNSPSELIAL